MSMLKIIILCVVLGLTILTARYIHVLLNYKVEGPPLIEDAYWGPGTSPDKNDTSVVQIRIQIPDSMLQDLNNRLRNTRFQDDLEEGDFNYGFQATYMKQVVKYWLEKYSWRKHEAMLNSFNHFKTNIEGLNVHFIHTKPKETTTTVLPLLLLHGWPGSVWEFYQILPMLTDIQHDVVFQVICPSMPGTGYSEAPKKKGFDLVDTARVYIKLMKRLGFDQFYVQGGDIGAMVANIMAVAYPQHILGLHSNFFQATYLPKTVLKQVIGAFFPSWIYEPGEAELIYPVGPILKDILVETGYQHLQATKPDTIGMCLTDSPVGLAAYILEKFTYSVSKEYRDWPDGGLTQKFTLDELLTNLMIYWTNRNVVSSLRIYKELYSSEVVFPWLAVEVMVPTGLALFPNEPYITVKTLAADKYTNIVQYTMMPRGGHFAALEEPELLANDVRNFVRKVEKFRNEES